MPRKPVLFNEQRLQAMMDRRGVDAVILRGTENSKYISEFFHNGGNLGYRPFTVFYFRDPARKPAFVVPAVDLHLAMTSTWIEDVRAYAMAEFFTDRRRAFLTDFFEAAQSDPHRAQRQGPDDRHRGRESHRRLPRQAGGHARRQHALSTWRSTWTSCAWSRCRKKSAACARRPRSPSRRTRAFAPRSSPAIPTKTSPALRSPA